MAKYGLRGQDEEKGRRTAGRTSVRPYNADGNGILEGPNGRQKRPMERGEDVIGPRRPFVGAH